MASNSGPPWYTDLQNQNYEKTQVYQFNDPSQYQYAKRPEKDIFGYLRGSCKMQPCECKNYTTKRNEPKCEYCGHYPTEHENLGSEAPSRRVIYFYERNAEYYEFTNFKEGYPIKVEGYEWPTSEHLFQAMKFQGIPHIQERIRKAPSPRDAFNIARENSQYQLRNWKDINIDIMDQTLMFKFTQHQKLKEMLLGTGDALLVEHTVNDAFWGDGGGEGRGRNELGQSLMRVRKKLGGC